MLRRTNLGVLADRNLLRYWVGRSVSSFGDGMVPVATAFAVLSTGGSALTLGLILGVGQATRVATTLMGGVVADRYPRRRVLIAADSTRTIVQLLVGIFLLAHLMGPLGIAAGNVVYGVAAGLYIPASQGIVPTIVAKERLQAANALMTVTRGGAMIIGPAVAGVVISFSGPGSAFVIDSATFLVNVVMLGTLTLTERPGAKRKSMRGDLADGWREVRSRRWLWRTMVVHSLWNFGIAAFYVLGPVVALKHFGGAAAWGAVSAALSVGALAGGVIAMRWRPRRPLVVGNLLLVLAALPLVALAIPAPLAVVVVVTVVYNAGLIVLNELWTVSVQQLVPNEVLSRVTSWDWLASMSTLPLGYAIVGPVAAALGARGAFGVAVALTVLPVLWLATVPAIRAITMTKEGVVSDGTFVPDSDPNPVPSGAERA
jgi:MFS family permease